MNFLYRTGSKCLQSEQRWLRPEDSTVIGYQERKRDKEKEGERRDGGGNEESKKGRKDRK